MHEETRSRDARESADERRRWDRRALAVVAASLVLLLAGAWRVGPTFDEHYYVASGTVYWHTGDFALNREHPPLVKLLAALPLLVAPDVWWGPEARGAIAFPQTWFYLLNGEHLERNLFLARAPLCLATAALALAVYRVARRLFSARAAFFATLAFALNPNMLAHGRLAALDGGLTVFLFLAVVAFADLLEGFRWTRLLAAGVAFGLANLAKFTALVLAPFTAALALVACVRARSRSDSGRPLARAAGTWLVGLAVFAAGYGFEARSVASVWDKGAYREAPRDVDPAEAAAREALVRPAALAGAARAAGMPDRTVRALADAEGAEAALDVLGDALAEPDAAPAALRVLESLGDAPGEARRRAFAPLVEAPLEPGETRAARVALAGIDLSSEEAWRAWWEVSRDDDWDRELFTRGWIRALTRGLFGDERPIPLLTAFKGIDYQLRHASAGHGSWFRGRALTGGAFDGGNPAPGYYAVVLAAKNPLAFSLVALVGLALCLRPRGAWTPVRLVAFVGLPVVLFLVFSSGNALLGVKYVLPVFPFVALWIAGAVRALPRLGAALCVVATLEGLVMLPEAAPAHPHELMYYNAAFGGPVGGPWTTVVGDDWGQGVREVAAFQREHAAEIDAAGGLFYDPYSQADPAAFGLERARRVTPGSRGIVAVHAVNWYRSAKRYRWLARYEPFARLGWSVYLFDTRSGPPGGDPLEEWNRE